MKAHDCIKLKRTVVLEKGNVENWPANLKVLTETLKAKLNKIPAKFRHTARIEFDFFITSEYEIRYIVEESDEDYKKRMEMLNIKEAVSFKNI